MGMANKLSAQSLYEIVFEAGDISYKGFLVYFNEEDAYIRIGYHDNKKYNVVDVKYKSITEKSGDFNTFVMIGSDPTYITKADKGVTYNPDHFIWVWNDKYQHDEPYVTDDPHFHEDNMVLAKSYREITKKDLTESYLRQFFGSGEEQYKALLRMGTSGGTTTTTAQNNTTQTTNNQTNTNTQNSVTSATLHLVLAVNTEIPDIGRSCSVDQKAMETEFKEISKAIGMPFKKYVVAGEEFTKANLEKTLANLKVASNDVVIFYYSGHGFRWSDQTDSYPQLDMRYSEYTKLSANTSVSLSSVYHAITGKNARLNLIMGDCCNSDIGRNQFTNSSFMASRSFQGAEIEKLKRLFLQSKGNLMFSGSSPGEFAWCNVNGGFFTLSFLQALKEEIGFMRNDSPSWEHIVQNTKKNTQYKISNCNGCQRQTPVSYIKINQN
jgi:hypothetical protein